MAAMSAEIAAGIMCIGATAAMTLLSTKKNVSAQARQNPAPGRTRRSKLR